LWEVKLTGDLTLKSSDRAILY